jgi:hypothetical protein
MDTSLSKRDFYIGSLPERPYCTDILGHRLRIMGAEKAAQYAMIQHNSPMVLRWMVFDIDGDDSHFRAEERGCPPPTFIAINRENGHGHAAYYLETPISAFSASSRRAISFFEDVERGLTHKLGADRAYGGFLSKNPLSPRWETDWQAVRSYRLDTLNECLDKSDKRRVKESMEPTAIGRNVAIFNALRKQAYKIWLTIKKEKRGFDHLVASLSSLARALNSALPIRLQESELLCIARSVARWVWDKFSLAQFSAIQQRRALKRWAKIPSNTITKPWEAQKISRRTWERRRSKGLLNR